MKYSFWQGKRAPGVSDEIDLSAYQSIAEVLKEATALFAGRPAFTSMEVTLSFEEIDQLSDAFAAFLQYETDLKPGDRVAVQLPNVLQSPVVVYGILKAGMVLVNTNPLYTAREMKEQFIDADAKALVFMDMFGERVASIAKDCPVNYLIMTRFADLFPQPKRMLVNSVIKYIKRAVKPFSLPEALSLRVVLQRGGSHRVKPVSIAPNDIAALQYTGGTTGKSKGAILTHQNLIANMLQAKAILSQTGDDGCPLMKQGEEVIIAALPLYHIYAFTVHLMAFACVGANNILIANPKDIPGFVKLLKKTPFSGFIGLNTLFSALLHHSEISQCRFDRLKMTLSGGTALSASVAKQWKEVTGCTISEGYGLTECSPVVCVNPLGELSQQGTVGLPVPGTEIKIIDPLNHNVLSQGNRGELCVRGPQVMMGYWQNKSASDEVFDQEGWLRTGDVAEIQEDGFVRIVDRIKDVVLVSGFNVYPNEIEDVVSHHPDVLCCAAVGIPDEHTGEAIKLFIVPRKNKTLTETDVQMYCKQYLTGYKVPHHIEFRHALPMTPVGKVLRRQLRDESMATS